MVNTPFTVERLLRLPLFRHAAVIGGHGGLSNEIEYVDSMEMPDLTGWLRPNELILTTGYALRSEPAQLGRLLDEMHRVGGSAIGIKSKRYLPDVPAEAIHKSDMYRIPLFDIPVDLTYMDMTHAIMDQILDRQAFLLREVQEVGQQLTGMVLHRKMPELVVLLGKLLSCEVAVLHQDGGIESCTPLFDRAKAQETRAICGSNRVFGHIAITRALQEQDRFERMCLEQAVMVLGIEFTIRQSQQRHRTREQDIFLLELLSGSEQREEILQYRAGQLDLPVGPWTYVISLQARAAEEASSDLSGMYRRIAKDLNSRGGSSRYAVATTDSLLIVCADDRREPQGHRQSALALLEEYAPLAAEQAPRAALYAGVSEARRGLAELHTGSREARKALVYGEMAAPGEAVVHVHDMLVEQVLTEMSEHPLLKQLYADWIGPLERHDRETGAELLSTLDTYLRTGGTKQTASEMFIHRNSVLYRLERIAELLGADLNDPEVRFRLQLALRLRKASRLLKRTAFTKL